MTRFGGHGDGLARDSAAKITVRSTGRPKALAAGTIGAVMAEMATLRSTGGRQPSRCAVVLGQDNREAVVAVQGNLDSLVVSAP